MEMDKINDLFESILNYHKNENFTNYEYNLQHKLKPKLRGFQERALKWMLKREIENEIFPLYGYEMTLPKGGILADEMGLGKTVEVLACVLSNVSSVEEAELRKVHCKMRIGTVQVDSDDEEPKPKRQKASVIERSVECYRVSKGSCYTYLRRHYDTALQEASCSCDSGDLSISNLTESTIVCFCGENRINKKAVVECESCGIWQHSECLGIENGYTFGALKCPQCWCKSDKVAGKATLIITPPSILDQWIQEIEKHVILPDFKYYVYRGIKYQNYVQPPTLSSYDIVLTTYSVLCSELDFIQTQCFRSLRHTTKYYRPSSPLICINWWRICLDEAQMVEGYTSKTATMASLITAHYRWAVTGTPIQKSLLDLYGLVVFLKMDDLNMEVWEDTPLLSRLLEKIIWRSSKAEVYNELGVPPLRVLTHLLHFSPVERHFYQAKHTESAAAFSAKLHRFSGDLDVKLTNIERKELSGLMLPLLSVRQACTHPQVVRGQFVKFKHTMTMDDLMGQMILKAKNDAHVALRQVVSSIHKMAGIHAILNQWAEAAEKYREVLQLSRQYHSSLKIDTLQMIHCLHNLAEVLAAHGDEIPQTLRDSQLRIEALTLQNNYLEKYDKKLKRTRKVLSKITEDFSHRCNSLTLSYSDWWKQVISNYDEELLSRITLYLGDNIPPGQQNISKKLINMDAVRREVAVWLANVDCCREEAMSALRKLEVFPKTELIREALKCHINIENKRKRNLGGNCIICTTEKLVKKYEGFLFSITKLNVEKSKSDEEVEESDEEEEKTAEASELKPDIFRISRENSWKPTSQERILHVLANFAKRLDPQLAEDGAQHLYILDIARKEFRWIRATWRNISDQVYANDELYMAKLRLRLPLYEGEINKKDISIIAAHDVPSTMVELMDDLRQGEVRLKRTSGTLFYLQNLQKSGNIEKECPVCMDPLNSKWSVLICGHCCCCNCIPTLLKMNGNTIDCPLCRVKTPHDSITYVQARKPNSEFNLPGIIGDHSTKVTAVVSKLLSLLTEDPKVKVLIFSSWEKVLDIIKDALLKNNITFRRLEAGEDKFKSNLSQFKNGNSTVLLLSMKDGSKGLNLTEATHLFFLEPLLNPEQERQAIGRIHRIGQTKETWVHRFVVANTIEERMLSSLDAPEDWAKENLTLRRLNDLFLLKDET